MKWVYLAVVLLLIIAFWVNSHESFKTIDPKPFNEKIAGRTDIANPEDLIILYRNCPPNEEKSNIELTYDLSESKDYTITLIEDTRGDDEICAEKVIMKAHRYGVRWVVSEIKMNWKYCSGYGHSRWSTDIGGGERGSKADIIYPITVRSRTGVEHSRTPPLGCDCDS